MAKKKKSSKPAAAKKSAKKVAAKASAAKKGPVKAKKAASGATATPRKKATRPAKKNLMELPTRRTPAGIKRPKASAYITAISDQDAPVAKRLEALQQAPTAVIESERSLQATLAILRNTREQPEVRYHALRSLQAASFSVVAFEPHRTDYIAALREVAEDPDPELRKRVLGILARGNDAYAEKKLLDGLKTPAKALVTPEKALQLLSNNPHSGAFKVARDIVDTPPNSTAKEEALRLLASDTRSVDLFEKVLGDKSETIEARQISASALHSLYPDKLQTRAREIVLDDSENSELRATCLTALANFGDQKKVAEDNTLLEHVSELRSAAPENVKESAEQFLTRYGK